MSNTVNVIYSVLAEAAGIREADKLRRTTQIKYVDPGLTKLLKGCSGNPSANVETLLKFMAASPMWAKLIATKDRINTYDITVYPPEKAGITFTDMLEWAKTRPTDVGNPISYECGVTDTPIPLVLDRLLSAVWRSVSNG